jgi:4-aminobutyrate aminotransferase-like enzyme
MAEPEIKQLLDIRSAHLAKNLKLSYSNTAAGPIYAQSAAGQFLYDEKKKCYLDCINNVAHLGHSHPAVLHSCIEQLQLINTNTRYLYPSLPLYIKELLETFPGELNYSAGAVCFLVNSGSEANDLALRIARCATTSLVPELIVVDSAYHGATEACIEISPYKFHGLGGAGKPQNVHIADIPDGYRGKYKYNDRAAGEKYAELIQLIIQQQIHSKNKKLCAFICESVLSCAGQVFLPPNYLSTAYNFVRAAGGICIADEVQVGLGRLGSHFWAFETQRVVPDIVTLGKPLGNGFPLAAVICRASVAQKFNNGMEYFNSFGGSSLSCAVGLAVLRTIKQENLQENAEVVGHYLLEKLRILQGKHEIIGDVRGQGLFVGVELVRSRESLEPATAETERIVNSVRSIEVGSCSGILLGSDGRYNNVIKLKPPMCFNQANVDTLIAALDIAISQLHSTDNIKLDSKL